MKTEKKKIKYLSIKLDETDYLEIKFQAKKEKQTMTDLVKGRVFRPEPTPEEQIKKLRDDEIIKFVNMLDILIKNQQVIYKNIEGIYNAMKVLDSKIERANPNQSR